MFGSTAESSYRLLVMWRNTSDSNIPLFLSFTRRLLVEWSHDVGQTTTDAAVLWTITNDSDCSMPRSTNWDVACAPQICLCDWWWKSTWTRKTFLFYFQPCIMQDEDEMHRERGKINIKNWKKHCFSLFKVTQRGHWLFPFSIHPTMMMMFWVLDDAKQTTENNEKLTTIQP